MRTRRGCRAQCPRARAGEPDPMAAHDEQASKPRPATGDSSMTRLSSRSAPMRIVSLVTAINVLVAAGFSIAGLVSPKSILPAGYAPTEASFIFPMYAAARTIPLAFIALIWIYKQSQSALLTLGTLAGFIPFLDAGGGVLRHEPRGINGPLG